MAVKIVCFALSLVAFGAVASENPLLYPTTEILSYAKSIEPELREIHRDFHRHPELGFEEVWTTAKIKEIVKMYCELYGAAMFASCALRRGYPALKVAEKKD